MRRIIAAVLCLALAAMAIPAMAASLVSNAIPYTVVPISTDAQESPNSVKNLLDGLTSSVYTFVAWNSTTSDDTPELTFNFALETVEGIWLRAGNQRSSMLYEENARPRVIRVRITTNYHTYKEYTYDISDEFYPSQITEDWYKGYQLLAFPQAEQNVTSIELFVPNWRTGTVNRHIVSMTDILFVSKVTSPAGAATPTPTPKPTATSVPWWYSTPTPKATATPKVTSVPWWYVTPTPTATNVPWWYTTPTPAPTNVPWWYGWYSTATPTATPTPTPTATPVWSGGTGEIGGALYAKLKARLNLRSGPGSSFDLIGTYLSAGQQVEIISSAWDSVSSSYWLQVEFTYNNQKRRGYTPLTTVDIAINKVPRETREDSAYLLRTTYAYCGPGTDFPLTGDTLNARQQGEVYGVENGWVLFQYYDTTRACYRRVWLPADALDFSGAHG